jgi:ABC-type nitrate/sulfonate/bicarbonate transport system substrate-binding protein
MVGRIAALALSLVAAFASVAQAEVKEVRLSKQFGLGYLSMIVIESQKLIEKHTAAAGLGDVTTVWMQHSGPAVQIDALLSGQVDLRGIHAQGRPHQEEAGELEGLVLRRRARPERKLIAGRTAGWRKD